MVLSNAQQLIPAEEVRAALSEVLAPCEPSAASVWIDAFDSPVGTLIAGATSTSLCLLEFADRSSVDRRLEALRKRYLGRGAVGANVVLQSTQAQLREYFAGARRTFDVPLEYAGTAFQQQVWAALLTIPFGRTWSYLDVAERIGDPGATRAVGMANNANPIAILIPCHRVINAGGELGGYGGGLWRKRMLLDLEVGQAQLAL